MSRDKQTPAPAPKDAASVGPARDFAAFCELEYERRRNSEDDFDPGMFAEAVSLVIVKLEG